MEEGQAAAFAINRNNYKLQGHAHTTGQKSNEKPWNFTMELHFYNETPVKSLWNLPVSLDFYITYNYENLL